VVAKSRSGEYKQGCLSPGIFLTIFNYNLIIKKIKGNLSIIGVLK
jgi:hypothetical protein